MELVVVDNGSQDGSIAALRAAYPDVRVVRAPGNVGYARAANLGTAATKAPIVAVINPDTVVQPGAAGALLRRLDGSRASRRAARGCAISTDPTTRRRGRCRRFRRRRSWPARDVVADEIRSPFAIASSTPTRRCRVSSTGCRVPRSGCARRARRRGRVGRAVLHVRRRHRSLLATAPVGMGDRIRAGGSRRARAGCQHRASPLSHAAGAPSLGLAVRASRFTGCGRCSCRSPRCTSRHAR